MSLVLVSPRLQAWKKLAHVIFFTYGKSITYTCVPGWSLQHAVCHTPQTARALVMHKQQTLPSHRHSELPLCATTLLTLGELRRLARLLQPVLLPLNRSRVASEHALGLQGGPVVSRRGHQRPSDAQHHGLRLSVEATAVRLHHDVVLGLVAQGGEGELDRLQREREKANTDDNEETHLMHGSNTESG